MGDRVRTLTEIPTIQRRVLENMDIDTWCVFSEVVAWSPDDLHRNDVLRALRGLQRRGLVWTRISDAHGRVEWAITDLADKLLAEAEAVA